MFFLKNLSCSFTRRSWKMKKILIILSILLAVFLLIQLIPYGRNHTNPAVVGEPAWDSPETRALAVRACFDCHSNETVWPWYSNIAPVSWLNQHDVDEARQRLNFSEFNSARQGAMFEIEEAIRSGRMPMSIYVMMHPSAKLTSAEKEQLIQGLLVSTGQK
jgi:hypothetical protein